MRDYRLSGLADQDLHDIYVYTYQQFGEKQADVYLSDMETCFVQLVEHPKLGRDISFTRAGYYRFEHQHYSIFYQIEPDGIFIVRVLHSTRDIEAVL
ncbi:type II toxin-antitoxin system RelE/ParE family toxin [Terasakiella sp. SH-1]|uniref:type II toxin-antitoxin system RelE/ParE family toxin n=1 Tax=Terasakiella sp. SH-1 TaxID=2560057 RepID=UPI001074695E|nr:type II toxin-antitoxin system RelE/ParE family toxin [Terasakiella sp. SH-1]